MSIPISFKRSQTSGISIIVIGDNPGLCALLCLHLRLQGFGATHAPILLAADITAKATTPDLLVLCDVNEREVRALLARMPSMAGFPRVVGIRNNRIHALSHGDLISRNVVDKLCELGFSCSPRLQNALLLTAA
ncbi:MAG: hypothetical protein ACRC7C_06430 [Beijerinckiaceae bacterium]